MKRKMIYLASTMILTLAIGLTWLPTGTSQARAQDEHAFARRAPHCTAGTVSGTYGYRLTGSLAGLIKPNHIERSFHESKSIVFGNRAINGVALLMRCGQ